VSIVEQAAHEMKLVGFPESEIAAMRNILNTFFNVWDSGGAVSIMVPVLVRLLNGLPLSPLTGEDSEWYEPMPGHLQNIRCSSVFKDPVTGVCRDIDAPTPDPITFPYDPPTSMPREPVYEVEVNDPTTAQS
jgi:hypothetical protein